MDKIALFDMDDTLADYEGQLKRDLSEIGINDVVIFSENLSEEVKENMELIKSNIGWWENLPSIKSGLELVKICKKIGFKIGISSQGPYKSRNGWGEKFNWCDKYVQPIDPDYIIILTRNGKGLVYGSVFVDDYPPYMLDWLKNRPRGLGIMPIKEWNKDFTHPQVVKYDPNSEEFSEELIERLQKAYSRNPGEI